MNRSGSNLWFTAWMVGPGPETYCVFCIDCDVTETAATPLGALSPGAYELTIYVPPLWGVPFESVYDVIPFQVPSANAQTITPTRTEAGVRLDIAGVPNATYVVESSSNLTDWTGIHSQTGAPFALDVRGPSAGHQFYRVRVQ